jgi:hypothetical protein
MRISQYETSKLPRLAYATISLTQIVIHSIISSLTMLLLLRYELQQPLSLYLSLYVQMKQIFVDLVDEEMLLELQSDVIVQLTLHGHSPIVSNEVQGNTSSTISCNTRS